MSAKKPRPILVPIDFSEWSETALLTACDLALRVGAPLLLLHVVHDPGSMPGYYAKLRKKKQLARIEDLAREMMDDFIAAMRKRHAGHKPLEDAEVRLVVGVPVTRILEVAEKYSARMIVMGSQGRTALGKLLIGSVASDVVQLSKCPVTIVKHQAL
jgi:nucleotide-binding universal stress UspA family protein